MKEMMLNTSTRSALLKYRNNSLVEKKNEEEEEKETPSAQMTTIKNAQRRKNIERSSTFPIQPRIHRTSKENCHYPTNE